MTGILNALLGFLKPAGGPFTVIQTFTSSTSWVAPEGVTEVEYLIVGGGGSGGALGGGGAGGYRTGSGLTVTAGNTYTITVGGSSIAGAPITENPSGAGTNTLKAYGGGLGGNGAGAAANNGGSGGGGARSAPFLTGGTGNTPSTSPSQGNDGGDGKRIFWLWWGRWSN
jgi:hypothetical protein